MEAVVAGALRREQAADVTTKRLAAEIEQLNCLVRWEVFPLVLSFTELYTRMSIVLTVPALIRGRQIRRVAR
jgi:hypothetical protein